jgi:HNH endonuclease
MPTCCDCAHVVWDIGQWLRTLSSGWPIGPSCANHPDTPGQMRETPAGAPCRNFRPKRKPPQRDEPPAPTSSDVRHIALTKGKFAIVDAADFAYLSQFRWHAKEARGRFYAATTVAGRIVTMHQLLMDPPRGKVVDHIDGNGLNNRRDNLRICTPQQNRRNTRPRRKSSAFLGVSRRGDKYAARIKHNDRELYLGTFDDEIAAARARDCQAKELFGPFAWLNFPDEALAPEPLSD